MEYLDIDVPAGPLRALRFGSGPRIALAAHGITASAMSYRTVARHLPDEWSLISLDLRGRGGSNGLAGPFGMTRHAADICAAAEQFGAAAEPIVLTGQSMGAYAALRAAVARPDLFSKMVLVDGGLPLPVPEGADLDQLLKLTLGPALARLSETYASEEVYVDFFRAHPALGTEWNDDIEAYARYDAAGEPGAIHSKANPAAVAEDGRDLLVGAASFGADLIDLRVPTVLLHAPKGMFGQEPGMLPQPLVDHWAQQAPQLRTELIAETNHYTILMTDRPAATIAAHITDK
ncbi:pimeloyl-ACP methyl ester carboxylesterase [Allocatelliglobosispora scoriae]|uniref:Pimeloyl-ACP methyl ester carboxylesterase n=1 Tax=Allocatelliglobosispora scoriae TaxID=643052 RepID=A0A841BSB1_9ACTN|nr:alpha/beta hydrolase [Allocatelliglobosispora scoriae]MBB5869701.1 pimeloyl-ACP methyl ester carboxylesterase [Allocatelliglobosispora scoriae]